MEDEVDSANNMAEQEESTGSIPSASLSVRNPKRLRSKVWDDFTPIFVGAKIASAECMHCHQVYNAGSSGTSNLLKHQAKCRTRAQKRPMQGKLEILPSTQKSTIAVSSGSTQKKLLFSVTSQKKCKGTSDAVLEKKGLALLDITNDVNKKDREVDHNLSQEELATNEQKKLALRDTPIDKHQKTKSHEELAVPEEDIPTNMNQKIPEADQGKPHEELFRIFSEHGHPPLIRVHDRFTKFVACLNPLVKMPAEFGVYGYCRRLFDKEKTKLKEKFAALSSRVCLSAYVWHYDLRSAFLCLSVHYIDDEWEKQKNIIKFDAVDPSCSAEKLSQSILYAIEDWGLSGKVFSITLDDTFLDASVASDVKTSLQKWNLRSANRSLFVIRYATHLVNQVIRVGKDELDKVMDKSTKCSKYTKGHIPSVVHYPNHRYALSPEGWTNAKNICKILEDLQRHIDEIHNCCNPADLFDKVWDVKKILHRDADFYFWGDKTIFKELEKMQKKFKEHWKLCCVHICMPMIMDPSYRLKRIKYHLWSDTGSYHPGKRRFDDDIEDYIEEVHDILLDLFYEYYDQVEDTSCTSGSKTRKGTIAKGRDTLMDYYQCDKYPYFEQPMTELDQYMQEPSSLSTGESGVLHWWKEHELTFPTIARMARDILAMPVRTDYSVAIRTARRAFCEDSERWIEHVVCVQDWLRSDVAGSLSE